MVKDVTRILVSIILGMIVILCAMALTVSAQLNQVDLDARGGYYSGWVITQPGATVRLYVGIRQFDVVEVSVAPTKDFVEVTIRDPENRIIRSEVFREKRTVSISVEIKGTWVVEFRSDVEQYVNIEMRAVMAPQPSPLPKPPVAEEGIRLEHIIVIIGGSVAIVIAVVAALALRKKPTPQPPPVRPLPPAPAPPPTQATASGETVLLEQKAPISTRETEIMLAALELPDGRVIPITSPRQIFGRADFERYVSSDVLSYISRRHFMISLEPGGFFIEDLGSANGTTVNDSDIRGRGKVLLKPGDVIGIGGVVKLRFRGGS